VTPLRAITLAAAEVQQVNSLAGSISVQAGGLGTVSGTLQMAIRPNVLLGMNLNASVSGQSTGITVILSGTNLYLQFPGISSLTNGTPWAEIPLSALSGGASSAISQSLQQLQNSNPLAQTQILAASHDVHQVGTQVINGVPTTEYAGTVSPSAALSSLSPSLNQQLAPELNQISGDISFNNWLDSQHLVRKVTENETVAGQAVSVSMTITSVNKPVTVTVPPASQVDILSQSGLNNAGL
jgi:hypothetical protein